jgi:hypothetical protein
MSSPKSTLRFSVRGMLMLTSVLAVIVMPLAKPWQGWLYAFPAITSLLAIMIAARVMTASAASRLFWTGLLGGSVVFLLSVVFMDVLTSGGMFGRSVWEDIVCDPMFRVVHGTASFRTNTQGVTHDDFRSFKLFVTIDAALLTSAIGAATIQFLANHRLPRTNSEEA